MVFVREKVRATAAYISTSKDGPDKLVIVGGGAAGFAAAEMLRRKNYGGEIVMLS
jgi:NADPH-dependent 2,4-dienoyl-CoA reductase/sulfur reductase-like enzyme